MLDRNLILLDPSNPMMCAAALIEERYSVGTTPTLHHHAGVFHEYTGTHYVKIDPDTVRSDVWHFLETAYQESKSGELVQLVPNGRRVTEVIDALKAETHLPSTTLMPSWMGGEPRLPPMEIISCKNGLLHLPSRKLIEHTPEYFTPYSLPFDYNPNAIQPHKWLSFLKSVWPNDPEAIATLQEMFGYFLTDDTRQQKLFLIVGPKRSGKGTIAQVLTALLGEDSVTAPTLDSLATNFGLAPLVGKRAAIIADARLSSRSDQQAVAERLLSISGTDRLNVEVKYRDAFPVRLSARFLILSNELPRIADASGALSSRFISLVMKESFYGREDLALLPRLLAELTGVLNWALDGMDRLRERGQFVQPASSAEVAQELEDLGSPISAFLRDRCVVDSRLRVEGSALFSAYQLWCLTQGRNYPGTAQTFGRDLRAALPGLRVSQPREGGERRRFYEGVGLQT